MATVCFALACGDLKLSLWPLHAIRAWPGSPLVLPGFSSFTLANGHADSYSMCTGKTTLVRSRRMDKKSGHGSSVTHLVLDVWLTVSLH